MPPTSNSMAFNGVRMHFQRFSTYFNCFRILTLPVVAARSEEESKKPGSFLQRLQEKLMSLYKSNEWETWIDVMDRSVLISYRSCVLFSLCAFVFLQVPYDLVCIIFEICTLTVFQKYLTLTFMFVVSSQPFAASLRSASSTRPPSTQRMACVCRTTTKLPNRFMQTSRRRVFLRFPGFVDGAKSYQRFHNQT